MLSFDLVESSMLQCPSLMTNPSKFLPQVEANWQPEASQKNPEPPQRVEAPSLTLIPPMPALETPEFLRLRCVIQRDQAVFTLEVPAQTEIAKKFNVSGQWGF